MPPPPLAGEAISQSVLGRSFAVRRRAAACPIRGLLAAVADDESADVFRKKSCGRRLVGGKRERLQQKSVRGALWPMIGTHPMGQPQTRVAGFDQLIQGKTTVQEAIDQSVDKTFPSFLFAGASPSLACFSFFSPAGVLTALLLLSCCFLLARFQFPSHFPDVVVVVAAVKLSSSTFLSIRQQGSTHTT